jgi:hypothetical protein
VKETQAERSASNLHPCLLDGHQAAPLQGGYEVEWDKQLYGFLLLISPTLTKGMLGQFVTSNDTEFGIKVSSNFITWLLFSS